MSKSSFRNWGPVGLMTTVLVAATAAVGFSVSAQNADAPDLGRAVVSQPDPGSMGITTGPDVTIIHLSGIRNWGADGSTRGYSVGTDSCNIGSEPLNWCDDFPNCGPLQPDQHPVIAQNLYRLSNGRFEQIGMSWLKHGFLSTNSFDSGCEGNDGNGNAINCTQPPLGSNQLGVGCTDFYDSFLNGNQDLGRRSEVNAATGAYPFPPGGGGASGNSAQRIKVDESELTVSGAKYWVEGHYVADNDALAGNGLNNASYREVSINSSSFNMSEVGPTVREQAAIFAWQAEDPMVEIVNADIPGAVIERFHAARRVTDLGGGQWHYEFAIHNMNSDRSARSFTVDFGGAATITNVGMHDIDHHSNEPFSTTDWAPAVNAGAGTITWSTDTFATNPNANALRWGTMFTFWFDANQGPDGASHTLGLFKTGSPGAIDVPFAGGGANGIFTDGFEVGDTSAWSMTVP